MFQPIVHTKSMLLSGALSKDELHRANNREYERLIERFKSDDFIDALDNYFKQKLLKNKLQRLLQNYGNDTSQRFIGLIKFETINYFITF